MADDTDEAPRMSVAYDIAHGHQTISFKYAHIPPTIGDMRIVAAMLRREADRMDAALAVLSS